jgi:Domain of unknown function (DUF3784)
VVIFIFPISKSDFIVGLAVSIIFIIISILFFKNKALFLIAGYDKEALTEIQSRIIAKAMAYFMLNTGVVISFYMLINFYITNQEARKLVFTVIAIEFIISLVLITYRGFTLKRLK